MPELIISRKITPGKVRSSPAGWGGTRLVREAHKAQVSLPGAIMQIVILGVFVIGILALVLSALVPALFVTFVFLGVGLAPFLLVMFCMLMTECVELPGEDMGAAHRTESGEEQCQCHRLSGLRVRGSIPSSSKLGEPSDAILGPDLLDTAD